MGRMNPLLRLPERFHLEFGFHKWIKLQIFIAFSRAELGFLALPSGTLLESDTLLEILQYVSSHLVCTLGRRLLPLLSLSLLWAQLTQPRRGVRGSSPVPKLLSTSADYPSLWAYLILPANSGSTEECRSSPCTRG